MRFIIILCIVSLAFGSTFVQITDVHIDPLYKVGSPANCTDITECCHADSVPVGTEVAGPEGSYFCDTAPWLVNRTITFAGSLKPSFVLYTGDAPDHDMFEQTLEGNLWAMKTTAQMLNAAFSVPIYPVLGNHDSFPMDQVPPPPQSNWLFEAVYEDYKEFLPETARETFLYGGYYTLLTADGHRLIALNTDYFDMVNAYVFLKECEEVRAKQLQFLEDTLAAAQELGEPVILASHIPPGHFSTTTDYWGAMLNVTAKYGHIIRAIIHGHTHVAKLRLFHKDDVSEDVTAVGYIAPSITSYGFINPSVRVFHINNDAVVQDVDQYSCDLGKANEEHRPCEFTKAYSMKSAYGLKDFTPASFRDLWTRLQSDESLMSKYWKNQCTDYNGIKDCDEACKWRVLCQMRYVNPQNVKECIKLHDAEFVGTRSDFAVKMAEKKVGGFDDPDFCV